MQRSFFGKWIQFFTSFSSWNFNLLSSRVIKRCTGFAGMMFIVSIVLVNCGKDKSENLANNPGGNPWAGNQQNAAIPVQAEAAWKGDISRYLMQTTTIEAERQVDIIAKVSGQVVKLPAEEGMYVKTGDLLAQLDEAELQINYLRSKMTFETDESVYDRSKEMLEKTFISKEDYEAARLQYESSKSAYESAKLQLEYTSIKAPFDGVITMRNVELGQRVSANQSIFTLADFKPLRAKIYVPEKDISRIYEGQGATITVEAQKGTEFKGVVKMISPVVDPESGTSKVTIDINDDKGKLKPGMFASVYITTDTHKNSLIIPKKSLVLETDQDQVYIYRDGTAHKVNLTLGFTSGENVEVLSGLQAGDLVVTAGQDGLREGLPIRIPGAEPSLATNADSNNQAPSNTQAPAMAANMRTPGDPPRGQGNFQMDPERMKRMEERMLQNPEIKKEWDKRLKADPDLKDNPEKKMAFFREMREKMGWGNR
ncbi:efflux RND transporter periplasmic adaptor subunit [candidate division KSB1 bacterium]|nr:efflux RND transporter periplasmic adaptor subunit [candidate division KSB1 bacterium]